MATEYTDAVRAIDRKDWSVSTVSANIPNHPVEIFTSHSGKYEVEISPVNGYDDGELHEDSLEFFVNSFEYHTYDEENDEWIDDGQLGSRQFDSFQDAADYAETRIGLLSQSDDA